MILPGGPRWRSAAYAPTRAMGSASSRCPTRRAPVKPLLVGKRNDAHRPLPRKARVAPQGPRAFCFSCPAGGIGIRACLRNMILRVRIPGGVPDFDGRNALPSRSGMATGTSGLFFYNLGCGQYRAGIAQPEERDVASVETRVRFSLPAPMSSRRLRVRMADFQSADAGSIPAGNTKIFLAVA